MTSALTLTGVFLVICLLMRLLLFHKCQGVSNESFCCAEDLDHGQHGLRDLGVLDVDLAGTLQGSLACLCHHQPHGLPGVFHRATAEYLKHSNNIVVVRLKFGRVRKYYFFLTYFNSLIRLVH